MDSMWMYAAGICMIAAALFLFLGKMDAAFVAATLGVVSWFLNYRNQLKKTIIPVEDEAEIENSDTGEVNED